MKKGQAAMEFLMTYGWAVLVVIAAVSALAYFGVFNPAKTLPEKCIIMPGIACKDFKVTSTTTTLLLENGAGNDITVQSINVAGCTNTFNTLLSDGTTGTFAITGCTNGAAGSKLKGDITMTYASSLSGFNKTITGSILSQVYAS